MPPETYYRTEYNPIYMRYRTYEEKVDANGNVTRVPVPNDNPFPRDDSFVRTYREEESKMESRIPKPNEVKFSGPVKFAENKPKELAEWEKELLGYSIPQRFMAGTTQPKEYVTDSEGNKRTPKEDMPEEERCNNYDCDLCYGYDENPNCDGCKRRDKQIKDLKAKIQERDCEARNALADAEVKAGKAEAEATLAKEEAEKMRGERNAFDTEADNLAFALEETVDQRDKLIEMLMWSEEQLLKAWEQVEELKSA